MGWSPGFLSNSIMQQDRKASIVWVLTRTVYNVWTTFENALWSSLLDVLKLLEGRFLRQLLASIPDGLGPLLVVIAAFLIISSSIDWNLIGWVFSKGPFSKISCEAVLPFECFWKSLESISVFSAKLCFSYRLSIGLMLSYFDDDDDMYCLNFFDISAFDE